MVIINGNNITLFYEGETYTKTATQEEIAMVSVHAQAKDYEEILRLCFPTAKTLLSKPGFWEEDGSLYYKNIKVSIPKVLADKFIVAEGEEFNRLIRFWGWLSLNPNPKTREELYNWIEQHGIQLTNGGLMILYRRVIAVWNLPEYRSEEFRNFIDNTYNKLRRHKKSTNVPVWECLYNKSNYCIGNYGSELTQPAYVGNLKELYVTLNGEPIITHYTDAHTKTKIYKIGEEAREPRKEGDENSNVSCSKGLHMSHKNFSFNGFGDTPIAVVVNPCDVLAVPDNGDKIRSCAFTPVAVLNEDAEWADDPEVHKRIDACYDAAVDRLEQLLSEAEFEDFKKHEVLSNEWNLAVGFETVLKILN